jgi:hypothetical protein
VPLPNIENRLRNFVILLDIMVEWLTLPLHVLYRYLVEFLALRPIILTKVYSVPNKWQGNISN